MVERLDVQDQRWAAVDDYIAAKLLASDEVLIETLKSNAAAGLPDIDVSKAQGRMLHLMARLMGARRILEIGTLGGFSAIELARALPEGGELVTLEIDPHHAEVARANVANAGLSDRVNVVTGPAIDSLAQLSGPFDFTFIDADKENNALYVSEAVRLSRSGSAIVVDNVIREGRVLDEVSDDPRIQGTRELFDMMSADARLIATAIQTVGAKKWDGFLLAMVR